MPASASVRGHKPEDRSGTSPALPIGAGTDSHEEQRYGYPFSRRPAPAFGAAAVPPAIARERRYAARNYDPLPVVLAHGDGCWLWDEHGRRYLDMMSAYSAVSHGHAHPRIVRALVEQAQRLAVTSRVFHNELLPAFLQRLDRGHGARPRASRERRRRGRRDRAQGRAQMGSQDQGHSRRPRRDHRLRRQFPRPLDHDRRLFVRAAVSRRLRTVRAGLPAGSLRRCRRARARDRSRHRRVPGRADPGRGRHRRAAGRLSRAVRAHLPRAERAADLRRDPDRHGPHREIPGVRARERQARRRHSRQGAGRRSAAGVRAGRHRRPDAGVHAGRPRQHVRRQSARGGRRSRGARRAVRRGHDRALGGAGRASARAACAR